LGLFQGRKKNLRQMTKPHQISRLSYLLSPIFHLPISLSRSIVLIRGQSRLIAPKKMNPSGLQNLSPSATAPPSPRMSSPFSAFRFPLSTFSHRTDSNGFEASRTQSNLKK
jgi:hypothetical protein